MCVCVLNTVAITQQLSNYPLNAYNGLWDYITPSLIHFFLSIKFSTHWYSLNVLFLTMVWCQKGLFFQMFSSNKVTGMSEIQGMKECLKKCLLAVCWMQVMAGNVVFLLLAS